MTSKTKEEEEFEAAGKEGAFQTSAIADMALTWSGSLNSASFQLGVAAGLPQAAG